MQVTHGILRCPCEQKMIDHGNKSRQSCLSALEPVARTFHNVVEGKLPLTQAFGAFATS